MFLASLLTMAIMVNAIAVAPDGALWFGTGKGLSHHDGQTWTTFTTSDGLVANRVEEVAIGSDGTVWIGAKDGASATAALPPPR